MNEIERTEKLAAWLIQSLPKREYGYPDGGLYVTWEKCPDPPPSADDPDHQWRAKISGGLESVNDGMGPTVREAILDLAKKIHQKLSDSLQDSNQHVSYLEARLEHMDHGLAGDLEPTP